MERCLLWVLLFFLGWATITQFSSPIIKTLCNHQNASVQVLIQTAPAMLVAYNPSTKKALITVQDKKCSTAAKKCFPRAKFFIPAETNRQHFWKKFKDGLTNWRYKPFLIGQTVWNYVTAWHERRTNLSAAEFILLGMELSQLQPNDFAVKIPASLSGKQPSRRQEAEPDGPPPAVADKAPLAVEDRPIIVEVLNASGRKGLALELTQYLREQNAKGLLRVDVLQYDNYPSPQESSWLEDYSGRQVQLKQLGNAIGINGEIRVGTAPNVICDTRIILGKDFNMPL